MHFVNSNIHTYNIVYNTNGIRTKAERLYSYMFVGCKHRLNRLSEQL